MTDWPGPMSHYRAGCHHGCHSDALAAEELPSVPLRLHARYDQAGIMMTFVHAVGAYTAGGWATRRGGGCVCVSSDGSATMADEALASRPPAGSSRALADRI